MMHCCPYNPVVPPLCLMEKERESREVTKPCEGEDKGVIGFLLG
jgi:hypothetical protein